MQNKEMNDIIEEIKGKIGEEKSALINDKLTTILSDNSTMNALIDKQKEEITKKDKEKNDLIEANGKLVQQVTAGILNNDEGNSSQTQNEPKLHSKSDIFDENGNFKN